MALRSVGKVAELRRYPVKSMAAEPLAIVPASWHGIAGDRRWAFIRPGAERTGFPWLTIRENLDLWRYEPRFADPNEVESSKVLVRIPTGAEFDVADPDLAHHLGPGVRVIKQYSGVFDTFPVSILTLQSVNALSSLTGLPLSAPRFRPNIVIDSTGAEPFPEDRWVGATLRIGSFRCRVDVRDKRCMMVNIDPGTQTSNPEVLRVIAQQRDARFGVYGTCVEPGELTVDAPVFLED